MLKKTLCLADAQIKFAPQRDAALFSGYASTFGNVDVVGDTILKGAYADTLAAHGAPKMLVNHAAAELPVGKWIKAVEDDRGLYVEGEFTPGMKRSEEVRAALRHGTVDGLSIGYQLKKADYEEKDDGGRIIKRVSRLAEISIVTFPADGDARIDLGSVKSEDIDAIETIRDFERLLRDAGGLSKGLAAALVSRAKVLFGQGEPAPEQIDAKAARDLAELLQRFRVPTTLLG